MDYGIPNIDTSSKQKCTYYIINLQYNQIIGWNITNLNIGNLNK